MIRLSLLKALRRQLSGAIMLMLVISSTATLIASSSSPEALRGQLACNDDIQISLDETCLATITPDMVLEGTGYNYADMLVIARDWVTRAIIDVDPIMPGVQIGAAQIGRHLELTVREISSGNSCWGRAYVEDKLAPIFTSCALNVEINCTDPTSPSFTGLPLVTENCGTYTLTYTDKVDKGSCALGYEKIITRTWIATDSHGNKSSCVQTIRVLLGDIFVAPVPPHFDVVGRETVFKFFTGPFDPSYWQIGNVGPGAKNGTVNFSNNNSKLTIIGANGVAPAKMDTTYAAILSVPYCGTITFDWTSMIRGGAGNFLNDEAGYALNGVYTFLSTPPAGMFASGTTSIAVQAGDDFRFFVRSDNIGREDTFMVTNFIFKGCNQNALLCENKINKSFDPTPHFAAEPICVDGYLLDSFVYKCTGARVPRVLGWNSIDAGINAGNPNPDPVYYPSNPGCWPADSLVMWKGTGRPTVSGCSNIAATYKDIRIDIAKPGCDAGSVGCYKILRQWIMLDWCTGATRYYDQIIKVVDDKGPSILYPDDYEVGTDIWKCEGRWEVPPAWITDNCSNEIHYSIRVEDGTVLGDEKTGFVVVNLPLGIQNAYIIAEDCCGNITEKLVRINVVDKNPPIAVCDKTTVVTITGTQSPGLNLAKINAETFDDGSFDNCAAHIFFKAIRMDELQGTNNGSTKESKVCNKANGDDDVSVDGSQTYFDDNVKFCCEDVGKTIRVVFRVFDVDPGAGPVHPSRMSGSGILVGHFSDCMIEVEVQDKSVPTVVAPPDIVVSCMYWFDLTKLADPADPTFGKVVNDVAWRSKVKTTDVVCDAYCNKNNITGYPGFVSGLPPQLQPAPNVACNYYRTLFNPSHPDNKYELVWGFDGYVLASCNVSPEIVVEDKRECGQGRILRTVTAKGPNNIIVKATQTIWIVDCDPFYVSDDKCDPDDDIVWPDCDGAGTSVFGCGANTSPDVIGRPEIANNADDNCALISIEHDDEVFTIEPDACFKILRKWTVVDWCQYDPSKGVYTGRWEHTQVIKVNDKIKPNVTCHVGACEPAAINTLGVCVGHISLRATASDSCTPSDWLSYEYKIDAFNDGTIDYTVGKLTQVAYSRGDRPAVRNNPNADNVNNPFDASGIYPIGVHRITWYVEDGCGNIGTCSTLFEIKDCKAPTPYCLTGIITVPMPTTGCIDIWAKDLDAGSYDNCTPKSRLKFYFNGDTSKPSIRICCEDFEKANANDELIVPVEVWVQDLEGNKDYCATSIIVQDNQNVCKNGSTNIARVTGTLLTEKGDKTAQSETMLMMNGNQLKSRVTGNDGVFTFLDLDMSQAYTVMPTRNDNPTNGVSTIDIVKIQKHILGLETIATPYSLIAADVNLSGNITASDISEIRKLILGINTQFAKSPSWTFVPKSFVFVDPINPWKYDNFMSFDLKNGDRVVDFVAIKMGDLNGSVTASLGTGGIVRHASKLSLVTNDQKVEAGKTIEVPFTSQNFKNINGYQFTINFDKQAMQLDKMIPGALDLTDANFGWSHVANGKLTTSWNDSKAVSLNPNEVLFTLVFNVKSNTTLANAITITGDITSAESYDSDLNEQGVELLIKNGSTLTSSEVFELYQNNPNPFAKETTVGFKLPEATDAKLTLYDVTGKIIRVYELQGQKGMNTVTISKSELSGAGMYYYQLDASHYTATKRMIIIE